MSAGVRTVVGTVMGRPRRVRLGLAGYSLLEETRAWEASPEI